MADRAMIPLPEILGWEPAPEEWGWKQPMWQHPTKGFCVSAAVRLSVDDLLAWLRDREYDTTTINWHGGGYEVTICNMFNDDPPVVKSHAPMLIVALEDCVRTVHEQTAP